jgi:multidrug efflux system membrane fusion protein
MAMVEQLEGTLKSDQGVIDNVRLQLTYCRITAPISGRIGLRLVDAGNMVHASDAGGLLVIMQVQPISVLFSVPADSLPPVLSKLHKGETLPVEAFDRAGLSKIAEGSLVTVDNQIDPTTGTARLKSVFDNVDGALFPNQFVNARLRLDIEKGVTVVPGAAVQRGPQGAFVYVVKSDNTVEVRPVTEGTVAANDSSIRSGLAVGEVVVIDGVDKLRPGASVRIQSAGAEQRPAS